MPLIHWLRSLTGFQKLIFAGLTLTFVALLLDSPLRQTSSAGATLAAETLYVFHHPQCPHCHAALSFLEQQHDLLPLKILDVTSPEGREMLGQAVENLGLDKATLGVPLFVYRGRWLSGFDRPETTGVELLGWVKHSTVPSSDATVRESVDLPFFGAVSLTATPLPILTIMLGLVDGFNPCAMWVLVYLISVAAGLQDRQKIKWLIGSFVLASGILYYLFMTAWLNTFLLVGYTRPLTLLIALSAIGFGINYLYELVRDRGQVTCAVGDLQSHQRTQVKIRNVMLAPISLASIISMFGLAFAVNVIEFVCSAALPAIYTHTLSLLNLPAATYYLYILLYVTVFMLDDLIIFALALFAVQKVLDSRYAVYSRLVGGVLLIGLGGWMLFLS